MSEIPTKDPRLSAIGTIAGCGLGALAVTLVFGRALGAALPALAILGTALAIIVVWSSGSRPPRRKALEIEALEAKIRELEKRLESAEAVEAFEERLAEKEAKLRVGTDPPG